MTDITLLQVTRDMFTGLSHYKNKMYMPVPVANNPVMDPAALVSSQWWLACDPIQMVLIRF